MTDPKPFFYYSERFVKILNRLNITLVFSTYQAGKLIFVSSPTGEAIYKYAKNFKRPMGIDVLGSRLAVASRNFVEIYSKSEKLAKASLPSQIFMIHFLHLRLGILQAFLICTKSLLIQVSYGR